MNVIFVDEEQALPDPFQQTLEEHPSVRSVRLFRDGESACEWVQNHSVDVAFLTLCPPQPKGFCLCRRLRSLNPDLRFIFLSECKDYAFDAFEADAVGYVLLPVTREKLEAQLEKAKCVRPRQPHRVVVETIPGFGVRVDGEALHIRRPKVLELFALLVDRGAQGITAGEGIALLWPERPGDANVHTLFRMTYKRLVDALTEVGIGCILSSDGSRRFIRRELVDCDLYRILDGDAEAAKKYAGEYLREYSWAEDRNGQLYRMLLSED